MAVILLAGFLENDNIAYLHTQRETLAGMHSTVLVCGASVRLCTHENESMLTGIMACRLSSVLLLLRDG